MKWLIGMAIIAGCGGGPLPPAPRISSETMLPTVISPMSCCSSLESFQAKYPDFAKDAAGWRYCKKVDDATVCVGMGHRSASCPGLSMVRYVSQVKSPKLLETWTKQIEEQIGAATVQKADKMAEWRPPNGPLLFIYLGAVEDGAVSVTFECR